ncbi:MAG TPA: hypothetical protein VK961_14110 [Chthoniobacter sp.]|nr:hypothetical protein [Chthoniobacter sp.]
MNFRFHLRKTQALGTTILLGSLAACTTPKTNNAATAPGNPPAGASVAPAASTPGAGTPAPKPTVAGKPAATPAPGKPSALDAEISGLRTQSAGYREYNEKLRAYVEGKEKQLSAILASDRSAGPSAQEFDLRTSIKSKIAEIDRESPAWQQKIDAHKAVLSKAGDDLHSSDLKAQIDQLSEQQTELLRHRAQLAALPDKLKP